MKTFCELCLDKKVWHITFLFVNMSVQEQKKQLFTLVFERMKDQSNSYYHVVLSRQFQYRKVDFFFTK